MTDDFLFDPWSEDEAGSGSPSTEVGEKAAAAEGQATVEADEGASHIPGPARPATPEAADVESEAKSPRRWTPRPGPLEAPRRPSPSAPAPAMPAPFHSIPDHPRLPGEDQPSLLAKRLRAMAVPPIEEMATRLRAARHRTFLDDRLDRSVPVLRFRLVPWEGPFDEAPTVKGSVFELVVSEPDMVEVRLWLDALAEAPQVEVQVGVDKLDASWIDAQLMEFVEKSLQRG